MNDKETFDKKDIRQIRLYQGKRMTEFSPVHFDGVEIQEYYQSIPPGPTVPDRVPGTFVDCADIEIRLTFPDNKRNWNRYENLITYVGEIRAKIELKGGHILKIKKAVLGTVESHTPSPLMKKESFTVQLLIKATSYKWHVDEPGVVSERNELKGIKQKNKGVKNGI